MLNYASNGRSSCIKNIRTMSTLRINSPKILPAKTYNNPDDNKDIIIKEKKKDGCLSLSTLRIE